MIAEADRIAVRYIKNTSGTYGGLQSGPPTFIDLRLNSENIGLDTEIQQSQELRDDRQVSTVKRVNAQGGGSITQEFTPVTADDFFAAVLQSAGWSSPEVVTAITISFAASVGGTQVISDSGSGFGAFLVGQWVRVTGADNEENNGVFKISAVDGGGASITVYNPDGVVEAAGESVTVEMGEQITNGVTLDDFVFEKEYTDLSNEFEDVFGLVFQALSVETNPQNFLMLEWTTISKTLESNTATLGDGSPTAKTTTDPFNAVDDVQAVFENTARYDVTNLTLNMSNDMRARTQVGSFGPISIGSGKFRGSGTVNAFYETKAQMDRYLNGQESSLALAIVAGDYAYAIEFPRVLYTAGRRVAGGENTDIVAAMSFQAFMHLTEQITCRVVRWAV